MDRLGERLTAAVTLLGVVAVILVIAATGLGAIGRYFHVGGVAWSFELTGIAFIWCTALGVVAAEIARENVALDFIDMRVGPPGARVLAILRAVILLVIALVLLRSGIAMLGRTAFMPTPVMRAPSWVAHASIATVGAGLAVIALVRLVKSFGGR